MTDKRARPIYPPCARLSKRAPRNQLPCCTCRLDFGDACCWCGQRGKVEMIKPIAVQERN